jgi:hypothetical protein
MYLRKDVQKSIRVGLCETAVRSVVTYCDESWTLTNKMEGYLMTWERKILTKMCGSI